MSIKQQTERGTLALIGLVVFAIIVSGIAIREIAIGGPLQRANQLQSDLVADILPPPAYIIEPYLEATIAVEDEVAGEHVARLAELKKQYEERKAFWRTSDLDESLKKQMAVANTSADAFWAELDATFIPALERGDFASAKILHDSSLTTLYAAHRADIDKLVAMALSEQQALAARVKWILWGSMGVLMAIAVALVAALKISGNKLKRLVIQPVDETADEMRQMASGNFNVRVSGLDRDDEIGQMAKAMEVFRETGLAKAAAEEKQKRVVAELGDGLKKLSMGDLAYRITQAFSDEYEELRTNFNRTMVELGSVLVRVKSSAANVDTGAGEIRSAADDLSVRTEQQAASLEETAAVMSEVTSTAQESTQACTSVRTAIEEAQREASTGGSVVEQAVTAMGEIEHSAQEISQIINVIDGIAFQTNLLALNAGVEAARAGDAGKGFAVVANEVRALAQRSAEAAKDIKDLITTSAQHVEKGVGLVGETGSVLTRIVGRVAEVSELVNSIANASDAQAENLGQVNGAVTDMDKMTQQNAAMVEETTAAARSLASEAQELRRLVSRFHIEYSPGEAPVTEKPLRNAAGNRPSAPRVSGNLALAQDQDDWSEF